MLTQDNDCIDYARDGHCASGKVNPTTFKCDECVSGYVNVNGYCFQNKDCSGSNSVVKVSEGQCIGLFLLLLDFSSLLIIN